MTENTAQDELISRIAQAIAPGRGRTWSNLTDTARAIYFDEARHLLDVIRGDDNWWLVQLPQPDEVDGEDLAIWDDGEHYTVHADFSQHGHNPTIDVHTRRGGHLKVNPRRAHGLAAQLLAATAHLAYEEEQIDGTPTGDEDREPLTRKGDHG